MKLLALKRYPVRKQPAVEETSLVLTCGSGIAGDCHADGGNRQISVLTASQKTWMEAQTEKGFCFHKFKENLLLDCDEPLEPGMYLAIGDAVIQFSETIKTCHPEVCSLIKGCALAGGNLFARVVKSGTITIDSPVRIVPEEELTC